MHKSLCPYSSMYDKAGFHKPDLKKKKATEVARWLMTMKVL